MASRNLEDMSEFTTLFVKSMAEDHTAVIDSLIYTKVKDLRFPLDINLCAMIAAQQGNTSVLRKLIPLHPRMSFEDADNRRAIHHAARNGSVESVNLLLKAGAVINCADKYGKTPLLTACAMGHLEIVKLLVKQCAHINSCRTDLGENAVHVTASCGNLDVMEVLLEHGGDPNMPTKKLKGGESPLHKAVAADRPEMLDLLCSKDAHPNICDTFGKFPIHVACEKGYLRCINILTSYGASMESRDARCQTPLSTAVTENQTEVARLLIDSGADVHTVDRNGHTPLHKASITGNVELMEHLVKAGANVNARVIDSLQTPLLAAIFVGKLESVEKLIELGADVTLPDAKGHTALHLAHFRLGNEPVEKFIAALLKGGGRLDVRDNGNFTPLQRGLIAGVVRRNPAPACIQLLCQAGSYLGPDEHTMGRKSPLFWLAYSGQLELVIYLVKAGWDLREESWIVLPGKDDFQDKVHEFMVQQMKAMPSLLTCCRHVLRSHTSESNNYREILTSIDELPLPKPLKSYLALKDIDVTDLPFYIPPFEYSS